MKVLYRRTRLMILAGIGLLLTVFMALMVFPTFNEPLVTLATLVATGIAVATRVRTAPSSGERIDVTRDEPCGRL